MRRQTLVVWSSICFCLLLVLVVAKDIGENDDVHLKVSIRRDTLSGVPSCQHTFSQIELLNSHSTDSIMIHSIQMAPEETVLVRSATTAGAVGTSWDDDAIPQQLQISRLPTGSLSLGPGQVAIVPVTFFPRYPNIQYDNNLRVQRDGTIAPSLSATAAADLMQIVGEVVLGQADHVRSIQPPAHLTTSQRRNNLDLTELAEGDEFEVSTTVVVDTSHGVVKLPISASSVRQNPYNLPDSIKFHRKQENEFISDSPSIDEDFENERIASRRESTGSVSADGVVLIDTLYTSNVEGPGKGSNVPPTPEVDCYDIFISNPFHDKDMEITEILVSMPEIFSLEFDPEKLRSTADASSTTASQKIQDWIEGSPIYIPPDSKGKYLATICLVDDSIESLEDTSWIYFEEMSDWIDLEIPETSLGYLRIKTDDDTLFVSLEWEEAPSNLDQVIKSSEEHQYQAAAFTSQSHNNTSTVASSALLKAAPERIDFHVMSSTSPTAIAQIALQNKSPVPMRLMRVSVAMDTKGDADQVEMAKRIGLKMNLGIGKDRPMELGGHEEYEVPLRPFVLPAAETVEDALVFSCSVNWDPSLDGLSQETLLFSGNMILRGTMDTELNYNEWRDEMLKNPYRDYHLVLEIPYTISVLNGRVEVIIERSTHPYPQIWGAQPWDRSGRAVSALFFPHSQFEILADPDDPLPPQKYRGAGEVGHDLRIISNMGIALKLEGAEIHDEDGTSRNELRSESLCKRFNVSLTSPVEDPSNYPEFNELGYLALQYNFGQPGNTKLSHRWKKRTETLDAVHTTTCYLDILTGPVDTGVHRVPLIIFPGQLDVSIPATISGAQLEMSGNATSGSIKVGPEAPASAVIGFNKMLSWFRESAVGNALHSFLLGVVEDKRSQRNDVYLLGKYLLNCGRISESDDRILRPILLKAGAIEHSEMVQTSLYLTNHNPVPVRVTIEVGEVEGMSIALGRDASRGRGDGSNLYDYVPRQPGGAHQPGSDTIVKDGIYKGHPRMGMRQFLLANDLASSFSSLFPYRDAVSLSPDAVSMQPMLRSLFQWHSFVEFHREPLPLRLQDEGLTRCPGHMHPPLHDSTNATKLKNQQFPGPLMISGDGSIARPLNVCWEREMEPEGGSDGTNVLIPPGGVARFDIRIRSPSQLSLKNDISQLLATGLVLSTSYGEIIPILSTFEALQGQLHVAHVSPHARLSEEKRSFHGDDDVSIIRVPLGLSWDTTLDDLNASSSSLLIPPAPTTSSIGKIGVVSEDGVDDSLRDGVSLFVKSTFSREVRLLQVDSCNPWFRVSLRNANDGQEYDEKHGINIGDVRSVVSCDAGNGLATVYPSYFQCALNWMEKRSELQPRGCGLLPDLRKRMLEEEAALDLSHARVERAVRAFERALKLLKKADAMDHDLNDDLASSASSDRWDASSVQEHTSFAAKAGSKRRDGLLSPVVIDVFAEAWDAMKFSAEVGLRALSTNLRAGIEYDTQSRASNTAGHQRLSLSMHNLAVETVLTTPRLFDVSRAEVRAHAAFSPDGDEPSIIDFPPAHVATVTSMAIPLRNPTSVPIRVRISTAPQPDATVDESQRGDFSVEDTVRSQFLGSLGAPYVQSGQASIVQNENAQHLWWDGGGAFFIADDRGDIVRSYHNITIRAGAGAHVSLVNPSLHSSSAFLVGCGARCGVRDDPSVTKGGDNVHDPKLSSPIGASAASGFSLLGRKPLNSHQANADTEDSIGLLAGGTPLPGTGGPSAFAIPYSALDEIVIPPFGVGEIGPVYFRPPGRFGVLGCETMIENDSLQNTEACESRSFESMIFLENTLTGLERVVLRGKGMWERIIFLDPIPKDGADAFGDIEFRNGRPTLMFSGTSSEHALSTPRSSSPWWGRANLPATTVVKEVVVHNGGDMYVEISNVYFSDTSRVHETRWSDSVVGDGCRAGSFRLLNCWNSNKWASGDVGLDEHNVKTGFKLQPGENRSIFIEHIPDCSAREEFVSLIVEFRRDEMLFSPGPNLDRGMLSLSRSGEVRNSKINGWKQSFRKRNVDLHVGYSMDNFNYASCKAVDPAAKWPVKVGESYETSKARQWNGAVKNNTSLSDSYFEIAGASSFSRKLSSLVLTLLVLAFASTVLAQLQFARQQACESFWSAIRLPRLKMDDPTRAASHPTHNFVHSNWQAAFRCLARADPTSSELQTLGREQIRQVIVPRYRGLGAVPPQCFNSAGVFSRERTGPSATGGARQRNAKEGSVGTSERKRTLSDSIFRNAVADRVAGPTHQFPVGLGWRVAAGRGMLDDSSTHAVERRLKTTELLIKRSENEKSELASIEPQESNEKVSRLPNIRKLKAETSPMSEREGGSDGIRAPTKVSADAKATPESESAEAKVEKIASKDKEAPNGSPPVGKEPKNKPTEPAINPVAKMRSNAGRNGEKGRGVQKVAEKDNRRRNTTRVQNPTTTKSSPAVSQKPSQPKLDSEKPTQTHASSRGNKTAGREKAKEAPANSARKQQKSVQSSNGKNDGASSGKRKTNVGDRSATGSKTQGKGGTIAPDQTEKKSKTPSSRQKSKAASSKKPPPSMVKSSSSQSMTSSNEDSTQDSATKDLLVRPPPGLAPPPGFGSEGAQKGFSQEPLAVADASQSNLGPMLDAVLSTPNVNLAAPASATVLPFSKNATGDLLFAGGLREGQDFVYEAPAGQVSESPLALQPPSPTIGPLGDFVAPPNPAPSLTSIAPLLEERPSDTGGGFDVMDFLDSILDDGNAAEEQDAGINATLLPTNTAAPVLSNPWAPERKSRAAAYGISFDDDGDADQQSEDGPSYRVRAITPTDDSGGFANIPLLTPAAILSAGQDEDDSVGGDKETSFYASLIGE